MNKTKNMRVVEHTRHTWVTGIGDKCLLSMSGVLRSEFTMIYALYHTENASLHFKSELRFQEL